MAAPSLSTPHPQYSYTLETAPLRAARAWTRGSRRAALSLMSQLETPRRGAELPHAIHGQLAPGGRHMETVECPVKAEGPLVGWLATERLDCFAVQAGPQVWQQHHLLVEIAHATHMLPATMSLPRLEPALGAMPPIQRLDRDTLELFASLVLISAGDPTSNRTRLGRSQAWRARRRLRPLWKALCSPDAADQPRATEPPLCARTNDARLLLHLEAMDIQDALVRLTPYMRSEVAHSARCFAEAADTPYPRIGPIVDAAVVYDAIHRRASDQPVPRHLRHAAETLFAAHAPEPADLVRALVRLAYAFNTVTGHVSHRY